MKTRKLALLMFIGILFGSMMLNALLYQLSWNSRENRMELEQNKLPTLPILDVQDEVTEDQFFGEGKNIKTGLFANITDTITMNTPYLEEPGYKYYDLPIDTNYQNITQTNLTFFDVNAKNTTYIIEDNPENFFSNADAPGQVIWGAMSFKIPTSCILKRVWAFVQEVDHLALWNVSIFNATRDLNEELMVRPDSPTGISILHPATNEGLVAAHWQNFTFPDVQLNLTNTYIDANGFAYYFVLVLLPVFVTEPDDYAFIYYSYDEKFVDDGYAYGGVVGFTYEYQDIDACVKLELEPLSATPNPSDIGLSIQNPNRPDPINLTIETNHSIPIAAAYNQSQGGMILAQNFTLAEYGTIHDISVYLRCFGDVELCLFGILPNNETGLGPIWNVNLISDLNRTINLLNGTEGWINFTMIDKPNLPPGEYWWLIVSLCETGGNITLFGTSNPSDNIAALNITAISTGNDFSFVTESLDNYTFATVIHYQPGKEVYPTNRTWLYNSLLIPDIYGDVHFYIMTRWVGETSFNLTYLIEVENNQYITPSFHALFDEGLIWWNLSIQTTFPSTILEKRINLSLPLDWTVYNVTKEKVDHGVANWSFEQIGEKYHLSIYNASDGQWTIWCNSPVSSVNYTIEKQVGGQFQPAAYATVYDQIRVNITIANQTDGICYLTIFYPDGASSFVNQTEITTENTILSWYPENDSAATGGNYTFVVHWSNGTETGYNRQYFLFTPIPANLTLVSGLPSPYVNDITQSVIVRYNDSRGVNITGATMSANLNGISLEWEDIFSKTLNFQDEGLYRIKLNTIGLDANQNYTLNMWAFRDGYENVTFSLPQISVLPVPTLLETNVENITQYEGEQISFSCFFKDTFHGLGIDWASINYTILGTNITGQLTNIMPGESVYIADDMLPKNLSGRVLPYQINITATAFNCEANSIIINLYVLNKTRTHLTIIIGDGPFIQGQNVRIKAFLRNETSTLGIPNATIRFTFREIILDQIAMTDQDGYAEIEISIPAEDFTVEAVFEETSSITQSAAESGKITVISYTDLALWIGIIIGAFIVAIFGIRQFYVKPKRRRKIEGYKLIANKFQDIANLRHLLILHKASAGCLYQQSFGDELDGDLISGFLSAISTFQTELKPVKLPREEVKTGGFELSYQDYKILLFHGDLISLALIHEETLSEQFRQRAQLFVQEYETAYRKFLIDWRGDITPFKTSYQFIAEKLELSLIWPHQLRRPGPTENFTSLEFSLIQIADTIMKSQAMDYFFLPLVISMGQAGLPGSKLEVIATVYNLRQRKFYAPLDPGRMNSSG
ncbi:MAG: hypothetical protein HWN66_05130 [Candidatus Helarchaeota archaeon]|nr:hypothetical protein [Candidatus Helarchaeota archaeon]